VKLQILPFLVGVSALVAVGGLLLWVASNMGIEIGFSCKRFSTFVMEAREWFLGCSEYLQSEF
jgi:hypothetical protein